MKHAPITPVELAKLLKGENCTLIDIREPQEHARGKIEGALNIPMKELVLNKIPDDGRKIVFHCKSGKRTQMAAGHLVHWAGRDILLLEGGIEAWHRAQ